MITSPVGLLKLTVACVNTPTAEVNQQKILQAVAAIPKGYVSTYGKVAELAGLPRHARLVGNVLKKLPQNSTIPWHRVLNSQGKLSFPEGSEPWRQQKGRLEQEEITFLNGKVNLKRFLWQP